MLGGGGAKGAAHVGVLSVLEKLHVPIDCIAGTSMGSIVGGLYASGMSAAEIGREMREMPWDSVFDDAPPRQDRPFRRKQDDDDYLVKKKPGFSDGEIKLPLGLIQGQKFDLELARLTMPVANIDNFDELPIPFRAIAADIETGNKVVLDHGNLGRALRASMAVPGAFGPVRLDGRLLVDGGIADNVPVDVARETCADVVIVVDLSEDLRSAEDIKSLVSMVGQLTALLTIGNVRAQLATLGPGDIHIKPDLRDVRSTSFDKAAEAIAYGEEAAAAVRDALLRYAMSPRVYAEHVANRRAVSREPPTLAFLRFANNSRVSDEFLAARLQIEPGAPLDRAAIEAGISAIYGMDLFQSVRYEIVEEGDAVGVLVTVEEKAWGPNYLQFGLALADDLDGDNAWDIGVSYLRTNINSLAGEVRLAAQVGERPLVFAQLYQPLDPATRYFVRPQLGFFSRSVGRFRNGDRIDEFRVPQGRRQPRHRPPVADDAELALGARRFVGEAEQRVGANPVDDFSFNTAEWFASLWYDTLDNVNFPSRGVSFRSEWRDSLDDFGGEGNYSQVESSLAVVKTWDSHTLIGLFEFDSTLHGTAPLQKRFLIGGFTDLSGFTQDEISGQHVALARLIYYRKFDWIKWLPAYVGVTAEYGNAFEDIDDISFDPRDSLLAGSVFLGLDSVLGPLYLGYGHAERGNDSVYLFLGRIF